VNTESVDTDFLDNLSITTSSGETIEVTENTSTGSDVVETPSEENTGE